MLLYGVTGYRETAVNLSIIEVKDKAHPVTCHESVGWGRRAETLSSTLVLVAGGWQHHALVPIVRESVLASGLVWTGLENLSLHGSKTKLSSL